MGLFGNKNKTNEGGLMDVLRCDEPSYLILQIVQFISPNYKI